MTQLQKRIERRPRPKAPGPQASPDIAAMIRVDHAGEYGAVRIYEGQLAVLRARQNAKETVKAIAQMALQALDVDANGLDEMDNRILLTIIEKFKGGPVGLTTIATAVGEEAETIEEVYEPFLIQEGYIKRTSRGREATELAFKHLKIIPPASKSPGLFS